jgi:hypothetical protein
LDICAFKDGLFGEVMKRSRSLKEYGDDQANCRDQDRRVDQPSIPKESQSKPAYRATKVK